VGMPTVLVERGDPHSGEHHAKPDFTIADLTGLQAILDENR